MLNKTQLLDKLMLSHWHALAVSYVEMNKWNWPQYFKEFKPKNFDSLNNTRKMANKDWKILWRGLVDFTTEFDRSQEWWQDQLIGDASKHREWWIKNKMQATKC